MSDTTEQSATCSVCGVVPDLASVKPTGGTGDPLFCVDCYTRVFLPDFEEEFELA